MDTAWIKLLRRGAAGILGVCRKGFLFYSILFLVVVLPLPFHHSTRCITRTTMRCPGGSCRQPSLRHSTKLVAHSRQTPIHTLCDLRKVNLAHNTESSWMPTKSLNAIISTQRLVLASTELPLSAMQ